MKKSALFLLIAGAMTLAWTVAYYGVTGTSIRDHRQGITARWIEKPPPADSMILFQFSAFNRVDFAGTEAIVIVRPDSIFTLGVMKHAKFQFRCIVSDSVLIIRQVKRPDSRVPDTIMISSPRFSGFAFYRYQIPGTSVSVFIQHLVPSALSLDASGISRLRIENCRISDFSLSVNCKDPSEITTLAGTCSFDSLTARFTGKGTVEFGSAGKYKTCFHATDSLRIHAAASLLERIFRSDSISPNTLKK